MRFKLRAGSGFTLIELLVVVAIVGILIALLLPAVQAVRESARRTQCSNNLKQLGLALHTYHTAFGSFPPGHSDFGRNNHSWMTLILPQIEQQSLYDRYDLGLMWNHPANLPVTHTDLALQHCPSSQHLDRGLGDYGGINGPANYRGVRNGWGLGEAYELGVFPATGSNEITKKNRPVKITHVKDGTTHTMMVGEDAGRTDASRFWADGDQTYAQHGPINVSRSNELFSDHPSGVQILLADGRMHFLSEFAPKDVVDALSTRDRDEVFDLSSY